MNDNINALRILVTGSNEDDFNRRYFQTSKSTTFRNLASQKHVFNPKPLPAYCAPSPVLQNMMSVYNSVQTGLILVSSESGMGKTIAARVPRSIERVYFVDHELVKLPTVFLRVESGVMIRIHMIHWPNGTIFQSFCFGHFWMFRLAPFGHTDSASRNVKVVARLLLGKLETTRMLLRSDEGPLLILHQWCIFVSMVCRLP